MVPGRTMRRFEGKAVSDGIAVGHIKIFQKKECNVTRVTVDDTEVEIARFEQARENVKREIAKIHEKALAELGEAGAAIFEVHQMLLDDLNFVDSVTELIEREKINAESAVEATCGKFIAMFEAMDNEYMQARAADVRDIGSQVIASLRGTVQATPHDDERPVILVADDLAPSEIVRLDRSRILAIVTHRGAVNSHTAILAGTMGFPMLTGVEFGEEIDGQPGIVDGYTGLFFVNPDAATLEEYRAKQKKEVERAGQLAKLRTEDTVTKDGRRLRLCANIGCVEDVEAVLQNGADGIGLFRSEFLYLGAKDFPTEEEQFEAYRAVAEKMAGKEVIIRTLDIGADKSAEYFHLPHEANPALGYRGIRICLERTDIFRTQLRAILRAACHGNVAIMYPMVISVDEVRRAKQIVEQVKAELDGQNVPYGEVKQGIMIETPAAVWLSEELSKEVDFFSIGTNDLTQYMLALDRQDSRLGVFGDSHHPAVLGAIRTVVENAHKSGIWVGICGELAADTALTEEFLRMGVDELSVGQARILAVRAAVRACTIS